jgi:dienelactone hydrolase
VITWGHDTTGVADPCAPTVMNGTGLATETALIQSWISGGWAVVRTDYEGLGTPGLHPYLVGASEGRAMLDGVLAARAAYPSLSTRVAIAGTSQGGHAALWADTLAATYTPELTVAATVAFAPPSDLSSQLGWARASSATTFTAGWALLLRGMDVETPALNTTALLTSKAAAVWPRQEGECQQALGGADAFGGIMVRELLKPTADVRALTAAIDRNDVDTLRPKAPLLLLQGQQDDTVTASNTQSLASTYQRRGADVTLKTYRDADHDTVVPVGAADATTFLAAHLH